MPDDIRSVLWASQQYGIHPKRLGKLLTQRGYLIGSDDRVLRFTWSPEAASFLDDLSSAIPLSMAASYINAPRPHDRLLLDAGHLVPFVRGGVDGIKDHAFLRRDLDVFLNRLFAGVKPGAIEGLVQLPSAAKRASCSAMEIVGLVLDGKLRHLGKDPLSKGYLALFVDPDEVLGLVRLSDHGGLSLREVEQQLGTNTAVVTALIAGGHLPAETRTNPVKRQPQTVVYPEVLATFKQTYVSLHELAVAGHHNPGALKRELEVAGITPALPGLPATFYLRSQVEPQADPVPEP